MRPWRRRTPHRPCVLQPSVGVNRVQGGVDADPAWMPEGRRIALYRTREPGHSRGPAEGSRNGAYRTRVSGCSCRYAMASSADAFGTRRDHLSGAVSAWRGAGAEPDRCLSSRPTVDRAGRKRGRPCGVFAVSILVVATVVAIVKNVGSSAIEPRSSWSASACARELGCPVSGSNCSGPSSWRRASGRQLTRRCHGGLPVAPTWCEWVESSEDIRADALLEEHTG